MTAYQKGATVTQALRFYLGDSIFFSVLRAYTAAFAYNSASSYDMRDFITNYTGIDMTGFFDNWVFNPGTPHYSVDSFTVTPVNTQFEVKVFMKQKRKGFNFYANDNIVELLFMDDSMNKFTGTVHFSGATGSFTLLMPINPKAIFVDPEEKMMDATTDNYKLIKTIGEYDYLKTFLKLDIQNISDSAFIQVTHCWAPPDSLKEPVTGMRLSDYRYWRIDGIIPENFIATGKFFYSRNGYLDNNLLIGAEYSVVILYRKNASEDWQPVYFERIGNWNIGNLIVPDIKMGEYTLAAYDTEVITGELKNPVRHLLEIYPNPSSDFFTLNFRIDQPARITITDMNGREIDSIRVIRGQTQARWTPQDIPKGGYLVRLLSEDSNMLASQKIIYGK